MSSPVTVSVPHSLGKAEAVRRLKSGLSHVRNVPQTDVPDRILSVSLCRAPASKNSRDDFK